MALANFTSPFGGGVSATNWATTISPIQQHVTAINELLYSPENHQAPDKQLNDPQYYKNDPYAPPTQLNHHQQPNFQVQQQNFHYRSRNNYLPPPLAPTQPPTPPQPQSQYLPPVQQHPSIQTQTINNYQSHHSSRTYGESSYQEHEFYNENISSSDSFNNSDVNSQPYVYDQTPITTPQPPSASRANIPNVDKTHLYPPHRPTYTRVQAGHGSKTQVHAVLDYDNEEYYDEQNVDQKDQTMPTVTPIQGPIFVKNGSVPVVPLFSYPTMNNGTFVRIPIWWTALSVALGLEIHGDVIKGTPCVKRHNQLFCPTAGNSYPIDRIEEFIDENKALMRRMYGDFQMTNEYGPPPEQSTKRKRDVKSSDNPPGVPDITAPFDAKLDLQLPDKLPSNGDSYFDKWRSKRQIQSNLKLNRSNQRNSASGRPNVGPNPPSEPSSGRVDACESKIEIVTPYWASNSAGKIRAIVNTQHFEQAIHQEVCTKMQTNRCGGDCGCEQKYKWHRLLAYDPDNDCKGIFMDWFLFPSCCVCRCNPN